MRDLSASISLCQRLIIRCTLRRLVPSATGPFAEFCCVSSAQLYDVSDAPLSDTEIGATPCAFGTALNLLARAGVGEGDQVLITGGSGGVGLAAVQLARQRGAP